jgi:hypothetical protein
MSFSSSDSDLSEASSSKLASQRTSLTADDSTQNNLLKPLKRSVITSTPNSLKPNFTPKNIARGSTKSLTKASAKHNINKSVKTLVVDPTPAKNNQISSNEEDDDDVNHEEYDNDSDGQAISTRSNSISSEIQLKQMKDELEAKLVFLDEESSSSGGELKLQKPKKPLGPILNEVPSSVVRLSEDLKTQN